jgi:hypothetical protein
VAVPGELTSLKQSEILLNIDTEQDSKSEHEESSS